jgi:hypothetical protein
LLAIQRLVIGNLLAFNRRTVWLKNLNEEAEIGKARDCDAHADQRIRQSGGRAACKGRRRSLANWLERMIEAEGARQDGAG